jgi:hypothetical protein
MELLPKLRVIDTVQRLGVAYHFDEEIHAILNSVSMEGQDVGRMHDAHLMTSLFRLLRQNKSPTSPGKSQKNTVRKKHSESGRVPIDAKQIY